MFSPNESTIDRVIRAVAGVLLLAAGWFAGSGAWSVVFYVLGGVALFTAATGFCLLYRLFGISTTGHTGSGTLKHT